MAGLRPSRPPLRDQHLASLDGVRGLAILLVFAMHYGGGRKFDNPFLKVTGEVMAGGWIGVDLFFVLSGFLITGILLDSVGERGYYKIFYARRALRIFPPYYAALLAVLAATPLLGINWKTDHISFFTYTNNIALLFDPNVATIGPLITFGAYWSLAVEEQFYLIWPSIIRHAAHGRRIYHVIGGAVLIAFGLRLACWYWGSLLGAYNLMFARMDSLAAGALLAVLIRRTNVLKTAPPAIPYSVLALCVSAWLGIGLYSRTLYTAAWPMLTIGLSAVALGCGAFVFLALREESFVSRTCSLAALRTLGKYSYGLYIYHQLFQTALHEHLYPWCAAISGSATLGAPIYFVLSFALNVSVAGASYHLFETRFLRLKKWFPYEQSKRPAVAGFGRPQPCELPKSLA